MRDPFPLPPVAALSALVQPWADKYGLSSLPLHVHEVVLSALFYTAIQLWLSPVLSQWLAPSHYPRHSRAKKLNWDVHVVSLAQSCIISALALYVMLFDEERKGMGWEERIWGYTGACGLVQAMFVGYFLWDFAVSAGNVDVFGVGMLTHAVSALCVYALGFRPFANYYGSTFTLYELSTPFLNFHWFFDKLGMTGSRPQLYNGIMLLFTFFTSRLVWGIWHSFYLWNDMIKGLLHDPVTMNVTDVSGMQSAKVPSGTAAADMTASEQVFAFGAQAERVPLWLVVVFATSNLTLHSLNVYWFSKMISAVRKRFQPVDKPATGAGAGPSSGTAGGKLSAAVSSAVEKRPTNARFRNVEDDADEELSNTVA